MQFELPKMRYDARCFISGVDKRAALKTGRDLYILRDMGTGKGINPAVGGYIPNYNAIDLVFLHGGIIP
jgi:hypothetical protein